MQSGSTHPVRSMPEIVLGLVLATGATAQVTEQTFSARPDFGAAFDVVGDLDGDGLADLLIASPQLELNGMPRVGTVSCFSPFAGAPFDSVVGSSANAYHGAFVRAVADTDGDGFEDFLATSFSYTPTATKLVDLYSGRTRSVLRRHQFTLGIIAAVVRLGDLDGDGVGEYAVSTWENVPNGLDQVHIFSGATGNAVQVLSGSEGFGRAVVDLGDIDGDGARDIAISSPFYRPQPTSGTRGRVDVFSSATWSVPWSLTAPTPPVTFDVPRFGWALLNAGDLDGDGVADLVIGAVRYFRAVSGATGNLLYQRPLLPSGTFENPDVSLETVGDLDGDGRQDYLAYGRSFSDQPGNTFEFTARVVAGATGTTLFDIPGRERFDRYGTRWCGRGDLDGDGRRELVVNGVVPGQPHSTSVFVLDFPTMARICEGVPNSTGAPGRLDLSGTLALTGPPATLRATGLPVAATTFFLTARGFGAGAPVAGSAGLLCLTGPTGRFVGPGQIQTSDSAGVAALAIHPTTLPTPTGIVAAVAGETWTFQGWHRDFGMAGATSNLTDGLLIRVAP
jgi:hypothetical protein